ncbi:MAG: aldo/keto reductase [Cyclobacteriaceae bacterium]
MNYRELGKTGMEVSEVSLGTWQVGGKWGEEFDRDNAEKIINLAIDNGVNFIDTADVYSDGESEAAIGRVLKTRTEKVYVASKCGRKISPHMSEVYTPKRLKDLVESSLRNMQMEQLDLIQLHCPPTQVYYRPEIFEVFDRLKDEGKIAHFGVSVEKIEEALKAMEYPNVASVQIIFNMFRQRPLDKFLRQASAEKIGVIARVPLASGLLTGKFDKQTRFSDTDHRSFNREGQAFDKGETFAGIDYDTGLEAVEEIKKVFPQMYTLPQYALRWILMFQEVNTVIPGASSPEQVLSNVKASDIPPLTSEEMHQVDAIYKSKIKEHVHQLW